jgi:hypothetical protein
MEQNQSYTLGTNLLKMKNACIVHLESKKTGVKKRGVFIPIEENDLYESLDEALKTKGVFLYQNAWSLKNKGQYGDTHLLKQNFSKEFRDSMSEDELKNAPILGNMKPIEKTKDVSNTIVPEVSASDEDDLPF